jgi:hypothetical protein
MANRLPLALVAVKFAASNTVVYTIRMARGVPITEEERARIAAALEKKSNATFVARKTGHSYSTVWRVAEWAGIELTAGREAKGYKRLSPGRRRKIADRPTFRALLRARPRSSSVVD